MTKPANTVYYDAVLMASLSEWWVHNDSFQLNLPCKLKRQKPTQMLYPKECCDYTQVLKP